MRSKEFRNLIIAQAREGALVEPRCQHVGECGGCAFQERAYADQVAAKTAVLNTLWANATSNSALSTQHSALSTQHSLLTVLPSPDPYGYRTRMDYVATKGRFGLRKRGKFNYIIELQECHLIPPPAFAAAQALWLRAQELGLPDYNMRSHAGFLRYVVVRCGVPVGEQPGALLLCAVTAEGDYQAEMEQLAATALVQPNVSGFHWLINDTLTDLSFGTPRRHWGAETLELQVGARRLQVGPNSFFQNNVHLLERLLEDVRGVVGSQSSVVSSQSSVVGSQHPALSIQHPAPSTQHSALSTQHSALSTQHPALSVADLYGGVGTIALHLADSVGQVVTVESEGESAALARVNIALNGATNVTAVASDVLPFLRAQAPGAFEVIVADPPRTGLGPEVCAELLRVHPQRIVYVSCNPLTQLEDLAVLQNSYTLTALRGYDMFPHTPHVETLAVLDLHSPQRF